MISLDSLHDLPLYNKMFTNVIFDIPHMVSECSDIHIDTVREASFMVVVTLLPFCFSYINIYFIILRIKKAYCINIQSSHTISHHHLKIVPLV